MSWLLAACIPTMLMLSTYGLQRLESVMNGDRPSATQVVARLEQAARAARESAAHRALSELGGPHGSSRLDPLLLIDEPGLPTRPNPKFQPSEIANPVALARPTLQRSSYA